MIKIITKLLLVVLSFSFHFLASQTIEGEIVDKNDESIAYASIQIAKKGTLSNEDGVFLFEIDKFKPTDSVKISYLGYETLKFTVKEFTSKKYTLTEKINELDNVFVSSKKMSLDEILAKIKENISTNYSNNYTKQQIFNRTSYSNTFKRFEFEFIKSTLLSKKQLRKTNKSVDSLISKSLFKTSTSFTENLSNLYIAKDTSKLKVVKYIELINKKNDKSQKALQALFLNAIVSQLDKNATYKVKTGLLPVADSLKIGKDFMSEMYKDSLKTLYLKRNINNIVRNYNFGEKSPLDFARNTKKYNYDLKGMSQYDEESVYVIGFKPKKKSAKFAGTMYVNAHDFAIVKLDFQYGENRSGDGKNLKLLLGIKYKDNLWKTSVLYKRNTLDKYQLKFIKQDRGAYVYMKRPFKFKKNRASKAESKKMIKMDVLMELNSLSKKELFFINTQEISNNTFKKLHSDVKYKVNYIPKYNANIWKGYHVLSPIKEIKDYDTGTENSKTTID